MVIVLGPDASPFVDDGGRVLLVCNWETLQQQWRTVDSSVWNLQENVHYAPILGVSYLTSSGGELHVRDLEVISIGRNLREYRVIGANAAPRDLGFVREKLQTLVTRGYTMRTASADARDAGLAGDTFFDVLRRTMSQIQLPSLQNWSAAERLRRRPSPGGETRRRAMSELLTSGTLTNHEPFVYPLQQTEAANPLPAVQQPLRVRTVSADFDVDERALAAVSRVFPTEESRSGSADAFRHMADSWNDRLMEQLVAPVPSAVLHAPPPPPPPRLTTNRVTSAQFANVNLQGSDGSSVEIAMEDLAEMLFGDADSGPYEIEYATGEHAFVMRNARGESRTFTPEQVMQVYGGFTAGPSAAPKTATPPAPAPTTGRDLRTRAIRRRK